MQISKEYNFPKDIDKTALISQTVSSLAFYGYNDMELRPEADGSYVIMAAHPDEGAVSVNIQEGYAHIISPDFVIVNKFRDIIAALIDAK